MFELVFLAGLLAILCVGIGVLIPVFVILGMVVSAKATKKAVLAFEEFKKELA